MQNKLQQLVMLLCVCLFLGSTSRAWAQVPLSALGTPYTQDFNTLASSGNSSSMPAGWTFSESGSSSSNNGLYTAGTGSGTAGDTYSFGASGETDRAIGALRSGTLISTVGATFQNTTGSTITSLNISYTGEMWRLGALGREDRLEFQYSTSATSLTPTSTTESYVSVSNLNFVAPVTTGTTGALNGNAAENRRTITYTIEGLSIAPGQTFWIRWIDIDASGADDGLAIDDFSLTPLGSSVTPPADTTPPVLATSPFSPADGATGVETTATLSASFSEDVKAGTGNILLKNLTDATEQTLAVSSAAAVSVSGASVTLTGANLMAGKAYAVQLPAGVLTDMAGNAFAGFTDNTTWNFNTAAAPEPTPDPVVPVAGTALAALDVPYVQNFDGMGNGTELPVNWSALNIKSATDATFEMGVTTGTATSGKIYNVGTSGSSERALGTLASASTVPSFGAYFTNNTGKIITAVDLKGVMEQWRSGSNSSVNEVVAFEYSLNATSLSDGTWTKLPAFDLVEKLTTTTSGAAVDGNALANQTALEATITGIGWRNGTTLWIRWTDNDDAGSDGIYAIDNFELTPRAPEDLTAPTLATSNPLTPTAGNTEVDFATSFSITFSELIEKGTGVITVRNLTDGISETISLADVQVQDRKATFAATLLPGKQYQVTIAPGVFTDLAGNTFAGIAAGEWAFATAVPNPYAQNFNQCITNMPGGWQQYSAVGNEAWECSTFGRNSTQGVQINGFNGGAKQNEDWLISPAFDLSTGFDYPLLSFWSRTRFSGESLKLMVSTNYSGSGDPAAATWKELNGSFPALNSDVWTQSANINLARFKAPAVYIAFVYTSSTSSASRWTLDDVAITNSETAPVTPVFFSSTASPLSNFDFGYVATEGPTAAKSFTFYALDLTADLTVTAPAGFELSKNNTSYTSTLTYSPEEAFEANTVYARFANNSATPGSFAGPIKFVSEGFNQQRSYLTATNINNEKTLDVMTWNIEWFGHTGLGPTDEALQLANAKKLILDQSAEVICVQEIANVPAFNALVEQLPGYSGFLSDRVSGSGGDGAQRVGFIYKNSVIEPVASRPLLENPANPANFWASGRLPYLFVANATVGGVKKAIHFIAIHAKANENSSEAAALDAYNRRLRDVSVLKDTLDLHYPEANIIMLGDYNDDVDFTVANVTTTTVSTYEPFVGDAANYQAVTKELSDAGLRTYITYDNVIDHFVISDELFADYLPGSAKVFIPFDLIPNYGSTTSDHMPVTARFVLKPNVTFASAAASVTEDAGSYNVTLNLSRPSARDQQISVAVAPAEGVTSEDFVSLQSSYVVTVPAGTTSATIPLTIVDDNKVELDEKVTFNVANISGSYGFTSTESFTLTVQDNDKSSVNFSQSAVTLSEAAGTYTVSLSLDQATVTPQTVGIYIQNGAGSQYGTDYTTTPAPAGELINLTIPAGAISASLDLQVTDDSVVEPTETITFRLTETSNGLSIGSSSSFTASITDNDASVVSFASSAATISENAGSYRVVLNLDQAPVQEQQLVIGITNGAGAFYGAQSGGYTTSPAATADRLVLTIPAGATSAAFNVTLYSNSKKENDKLVSFALVGQSAGLASGSTYSFALTIADEASQAVAGPGSNSEMEVSPNPSGGAVTVSFAGDEVSAASANNSSDLVLTLWDGQRGQNILSVTGDLYTITNALNEKLATCPKGMYILKIVNDTTFYQKRLLRN